MRMNLGKIASLDAGQIEALPDYPDLLDFETQTGSPAKATKLSTTTDGNEPGKAPYVPFSSTISWTSKADPPAHSVYPTVGSSDPQHGAHEESRPRAARSVPTQRSSGPAARQRSEDMMTCPKCGKTMMENELPGHFRAEHQSSGSANSRATKTVKSSRQAKNKGSDAGVHDSSPLLDAVCPKCGAKLRAANLEKHLRKCQGTRVDVATVKGPPNRQQVGSLICNVDDDDEHAFLDGDIETVTDEFYDQRYGDKYVGQSWPESSGQYGSIPLFDDYSDEGEA